MQETDDIQNFRAGLLIRQASPDDLEVVAFLLNDLGYPLNPAQVRNTFMMLLRDPQAKILLATRGRQVVGMVSLHSYTALRLNGCQVTVEELVVHPNFRGRGIGQELIAAAYRYAEMAGAVRIELKTGDTRESFKRGFYDKNGFERADIILYRKYIS
jgi:GNAT superfamily N-acetyltransferase